MAIQLVVLEDALLDGAVRERPLRLAAELIVLERAFFDQAVRVDARCVTVHLAISVLALGKASVRQMDA